MNTKILLVGLMPLLLFSCQDDSLAPTIEPQSTNMRVSESRGLDCSLFVSYNTEKSTHITSKDEELDSECLYDIISNSTVVVKQAIQSCFSDSQLPCTIIRDISERSMKGSRSNKDGSDYSVTYVKEMQICNGQATVTSSNGETTSFQVEAQEEHSMHMFGSLMMTQEEIDSSMSVMINELEQSGSQFEISGNYLTITEKFDDGSSMAILYDIHNGVLVGESMTDENGEIVWSKSNVFTCNEDGRLVIDVSKSFEVLKSYYCDQTIIKNEITDYSNFIIEKK